MALNETCEERDYLYGRLLAVADRIEYRTYDTEKDSGRVTNAKRYMNTFLRDLLRHGKLSKKIFSHI